MSSIQNNQNSRAFNLREFLQTQNIIQLIGFIVAIIVAVISTGVAALSYINKKDPYPLTVKNPLEVNPAKITVKCEECLDIIPKELKNKPLHIELDSILIEQKAILVDDSSSTTMTWMVSLMELPKNFRKEGKHQMRFGFNLDNLCPNRPVHFKYGTDTLTTPQLQSYLSKLVTTNSDSIQNVMIDKILFNSNPYAKVKVYRTSKVRTENGLQDTVFSKKPFLEKSLENFLKRLVILGKVGNKKITIDSLTRDENGKFFSLIIHEKTL